VSRSAFGVKVEQEPGWYPDPSNPGIIRWHDGTAWTAMVQRVDADCSDGCC